MYLTSATTITKQRAKLKPNRKRNETKTTTKGKPVNTSAKSLNTRKHAKRDIKRESNYSARKTVEEQKRGLSSFAWQLLVWHKKKGKQTKADT